MIVILHFFGILFNFFCEFYCKLENHIRICNIKKFKTIF